MLSIPRDTLVDIPVVTTYSEYRIFGPIVFPTRIQVEQGGFPVWDGTSIYFGSYQPDFGGPFVDEISLDRKILSELAIHDPASFGAVGAGGRAGGAVVMDVPAPGAQPGFVLVRTLFSVVSPGTERTAAAASGGDRRACP